MANVDDTSGQSGHYFVYLLLRPDSSPFYVGKGGDVRRIGFHERAARQGKPGYKYNTIRSIWRSGGDVTRRIVFRSDSEDAIYAEETRLIAFYGRDNLCNLTDGGVGMLNPPDHVRQRLGASMRGKKQSPEHKEKIRQANIGKKRSQEARDRMRAARLGKTSTPQQRAKIAAWSQSYWAGTRLERESADDDIYRRRAKGESVEDIARDLGLSVSRVYVRLKRARARLSSIE